MMVLHYEKLDELMEENDEILAIVVASLRTAKKIKRKFIFNNFKSKIE